MAEFSRPIPNLDPSKRYAIRVRAMNPYNVASEWSEAMEFTTPENTSQATTFPKVYNLSKRETPSVDTGSWTVTSDDLDIVVPSGAKLNIRGRIVAFDDGGYVNSTVFIDDVPYGNGPSDPGGYGGVATTTVQPDGATGVFDGFIDVSAGNHTVHMVISGNGATSPGILYDLVVTFVDPSATTNMVAGSH